MSKKSQRRARRHRHRRKHVLRAMCDNCQRHVPADPESLLSSLATALNACDSADIRIRLRHGIIMTRQGYVLPLQDGTWAARTLNYDPFSPPDSGTDDDYED